MTRRDVIQRFILALLACILGPRARQLVDWGAFDAAVGRLDSGTRLRLYNDYMAAEWLRLATSERQAQMLRDFALYGVHVVDAKTGERRDPLTTPLA